MEEVAKQQLQLSSCRLKRLTGNTNYFAIRLLGGEAGFKGLAPFWSAVRLLNRV